MKTKLGFGAFFFAAVAAFSQGGWSVPKSIKITFTEKGAMQGVRTYTVSRLGKSSRVDGTFAVYGALAKLPHSEISNENGNYLYVPELKAALQETTPVGPDRMDSVRPTPIKKSVFDLPKSMLEKELKQPARFEGEEKVAGRDCYVLTTSEPTSSMRGEKRWIDKTFGIVLKYQRMEAGKAAFTREATAASFDGAIAEDTFKLPADAQITVAGIVSPSGFEKLHELGDQAKFQDDLRDMGEKQSKRNPNMFAVAGITTPANLGYAVTTFRPGTKGLPNRTGGGSTGAGGQKPADPNQPIRIAFSSPDGAHQIQAVIATDDGNVGDQVVKIAVPLQLDGTVDLQGDFQGGNFVFYTSDDALTQDEMKEIERATNKEQATQRIMARKQAGKPTEGMFISEFIDNATGKSLVFYQTQSGDVTQSIASKAQLGDPEKVSMNGTSGDFYHTSAPFERSVFVWHQGRMCYGIAASGLTKEEITKIAASAQVIPGK